MRKFKFAALMVSSILIVAACVRPDSTEAEAKIEEFHNHYNAEQFEQIYAAASPQFRNNVEADEMFDFLKSMRGEIGEWKYSEIENNMAVTGMSPEPTIVLTLRSQFEQDSATEIFKYVREDDEYFLREYTVRLNIEADEFFDPED